MSVQGEGLFWSTFVEMPCLWQMAVDLIKITGTLQYHDSILTVCFLFVFALSDVPSDWRTSP